MAGGPAFGSRLGFVTPGRKLHSAMTLPPPWPTKKHPGHNRVGSPLANPILKPSSASTTSRSSHGTSNVSGLRSNCSAPQHRSAGAGNAMRMPTQDTSYMPGSMSSS